MVIDTWVDASYAVHGDIRSHTDDLISLGCEAILSKSSKTKINTKSSTEAKLVGASNYLPTSVLTGYLLEAQGYKLETQMFHQDNMSAMKLEENRRK